MGLRRILCPGLRSPPRVAGRSPAHGVPNRTECRLVGSCARLRENEQQERPKELLRFQRRLEPVGPVLCKSLLGEQMHIAEPRIFSRSLPTVAANQRIHAPSLFTNCGTNVRRSSITVDASSVAATVSKCASSSSQSCVGSSKCATISRS